MSNDSFNDIQELGADSTYKDGLSYNMTYQETPKKSTSKFNPSTDDRTEKLSSLPKPDFTPFEKLSSSLSFKKRGIYKRKQSQLPPSSSKIFADYKYGSNSFKFGMKRMSFGTEKNEYKLMDEDSKNSNEKNSAGIDFRGTIGVSRRIDFNNNVINEKPKFFGESAYSPPFINSHKDKIKKALFQDDKEEEGNQVNKNENIFTLTSSQNKQKNNIYIRA